MSSFDPAVQRLLVAHGGVISRRELLELKMSASAVARRVTAGEFVPVLPGVYRLTTTPLTPELRLRAVVLRLGPDAVIAGRPAAWWHGLTKTAAPRVVVILPPRRGHGPFGGVQVIRTRLDRADRTVVRALPVTQRARTVLDCAGESDADDIRDAALQRGTSIWSLERALARRGSARGVAVARRLLLAAKDGGVSPPERLALHALLRAGCERWTAGVRVRVGAGQEYWLDLAVEDIKLCVEVDGWTVHSQAEAYHSDRGRQNALTLAGWTVLRYTPRQLRSDLDGAVDEILEMSATLRRSRRGG